MTTLQKLKEVYNQQNKTKQEHLIDTEFEVLSFISLNKNKALLKLHQLITEFASHYSKILDFNRQISECVYSIYKQSYEPYRSMFNDETLFNNYHELFENFSNMYSSTHLKTIDIFNNYIDKISLLIEHSNEFKTYYSEMDAIKKEKDESFKYYQYYFNKLKKLNNANKKDNIRIIRNEEKFMQAHTNYLSKNYIAYDHLNLLDCNLFKKVNQCLFGIYDIERNLFKDISDNFNLNQRGIIDELKTAENKVSDVI